MKRRRFDTLRNCPPPRRFWQYIDSRTAGNSKIARSSNKGYCSGETLIEALIAISILTIVMAPAAGMYVNSINTTAANRNNLIATGFVEEGVEIVLNMRDTNFLRFSPKAAACWNTKPEHTTLGDAATDFDACDNPANKIGAETSTAAQRFRVILDPDTLDWKLVPPTPATAHLSDASAGDATEEAIEQYRLYEDVAVPGVNEECTALGTPDHCSFHTSLYFTPETLPGPGGPVRGRESIFYRQITIEYLDSNGDSVAESSMRVTSLVQYRTGSRLRNIKRVLILTNQSV